jgi:hypothetical protein
MTGLLVQAERAGITACAEGPFWEFMITSEFICTQAQVNAGAHYYLFPPSDAAARRHAFIVLRSALVTAGRPGT